MSLSPEKQGRFRPLVKEAWLKTCARENRDPSDKIAKDKWYRAELMKALGIYTTNEAVASREFATLCAHFEQIIGKSCYWTIRAEQPEAVRQIRWWIDQALKRIGGDWKYAQGIIAQMNFPGIDLDDLDIVQLRKVFQSLDTYIRRQQDRTRKEMPLLFPDIPDWKDVVREAEAGAPRSPHRRAA